MTATRTPIRSEVSSQRPNETRGFTRFILRHRLSVCLLWLIVTVAGVALAGSTASRLTPSSTFPGLKSYEAGLAITHQYGNGGNESPTVVVVTLPAHERVDSGTGRVALQQTWSALDGSRSVRTASPASISDPRLISADGRSALGLVFGTSGQPTPTDVADLLRSSAPSGVTVTTTSLTALYGAPSSGGVGVLGEVLIGAIGALIVLVVVFGSYLAVLPLVVAAVSILTTFLLIGGLTTFTEVSQLVEYVVALVGLGIAIDYSLLIVSRWREERANGSSDIDAVVRSMATAGRSVAFSGVTVGLSLLSLILLPGPSLRSLGIGGLLIPLVTVAAASTLLPVLLASWGPTLDRRGRRSTRSCSHIGTRQVGRLGKARGAAPNHGHRRLGGGPAHAPRFDSQSAGRRGRSERPRPCGHR